MSDTRKTWDDDLKMENLAFYETLDPDSINDDDTALSADELTEDELLEAVADSDEDMAISADDPNAFGETVNPLTDLDDNTIGMADSTDGIEDADEPNEAAILQEELSASHDRAAADDGQP